MMAILSSPLQLISSTPLTTRCYTGATIAFSLLYQLIRWNDWPPYSTPYLTLIPGSSLFYPWTFFTAGLVEVTILELLLTLVFVPISLRYFERLWGSLETFLFIVITITVPNIISFTVNWAEFLLTKNADLFLYGMEYHGQMALQTGILVAFTQLIPEHQVQVFGVLKIRVKRLPMAYVTLSTIMVLIGYQSPWITIQFGWLVAWAYLRFYKKNKGDTIVGDSYGDRSETFAFVQWFPPVVHPPINMLGKFVYPLATRFHLIPGAASDIESGGYSQVPGGQRAEAERRRALALKALDQRMASSSGQRDSAHQPADSGSRSSSSPPQNARDKRAHNGSALPTHATSSSPQKSKSRDDLQGMDPDDIFAKHTVHEVKTILLRLRSEVDAKQEELRLMVGERYRDLLEASSSIISMAESSKRAVHTIATMKRKVLTDPVAEQSQSRVSKDDDLDDANLKNYQSLAAHLKFLVDAPEHLWRLLERKQCLHAAWLFLLSRVVYRSLMDQASDEGQGWVQQGISVKEQFPLVQKQWDSISQFRAQISHRATLSLRDHDLNPQDLCSAMFTLHLLDSLPLPDALDVFLKQRSRTLQHLYQTINESWEKHLDTSSIQAENERKSVWDIIRSVLGCVVGTVGNARAVFGEGPDESPSMIMLMLVSTQADSPHPTFSLPQELRLSSQAVISSLPSASHFQALPADIRTYKPFIDLESPSSRIREDALNSRLRAWFTKATDHLHESSGPWLSHLQTIKKVWGLRLAAMNWLSVSSDLLVPEDTEVLSLLVDEVCRSRVQALWKAILKKISSSFRESLESMVLAISELQGDAYLDLSPVEYLLSAPTVSSLTQSSFNASLAQSSFRRFKQGIQQRIDGITPRIDKTLSDAESAALNLRNDLKFAFEDGKGKSLPASYISDSEIIADELLDSIKDMLDTRERNSVSEHSLQCTYLLGRLAQKLSLSPLIAYLRCSDNFSDSWHARARQIYDSCVYKCASMIALSARDRYAQNPASRSHDVHRNLMLPFSPSPTLMDSLLILVESIDRFAQFKNVSQRSAIAKVLLTRFSNTTVDSIRESADLAQVQLIWDLSFLKAICDEWGTVLCESVASLDKVVRHSYQSLPPDIRESHSNLEEELHRSVAQSIKAVRLLLSPLFTSSDYSSSMKSPKSTTLDLDRRNKLSGESEGQTMLNLVRPSARFGLLVHSGCRTSSMYSPSAAPPRPRMKSVNNREDDHQEYLPQKIVYDQQSLPLYIP
ncbi:hypothetical protein ACEPAF_3937 [Sanghuangporus sanghuang]